MIDKVYLTGFRATGKSTVGKELARMLGWEFVDMDDEIVRRAGKSIADLTKGGRSWREFREMEQVVMIDLLKRSAVVVGMGGGALVNNIMKEGTDKSYGELNADLLKQDSSAAIILLTASDDIIYDRMRNDELIKVSKDGVLRPLLNEERARRLEEKGLNVEEILKDSMDMLRVRKPLYVALTDIVVDTGVLTPKQTAEEIIKYL